MTMMLKSCPLAVAISLGAGPAERGCWLTTGVDLAELGRETLRLGQAALRGTALTTRPHATEGDICQHLLAESTVTQMTIAQR
jgi:hypothetical protein